MWSEKSAAEDGRGAVGGLKGGGGVGGRLLLGGCCSSFVLRPFALLCVAFSLVPAPFSALLGCCTVCCSLLLWVCWRCCCGVCALLWLCCAALGCWSCGHGSVLRLLLLRLCC